MIVGYNHNLYELFHLLRVQLIRLIYVRMHALCIRKDFYYEYGIVMNSFSNMYNKNILKIYVGPVNIMSI